MEFNKNESAILAGSTTVEAAAGEGTGEIDLYDELEVFAGLSLEEQQRLVARPKAAIEEAFEPSHPDSDSTIATSKAVVMETTKPQPSSTSEPEDSVAGGGLSEVSSEAAQVSNLRGSIATPSLTTTQAPSNSEGPTANGETSDADTQLFDHSRTGPLLAGLNVPESLFAGDLSLGTCLACGAESGADDLFCVSCGVFIDDIGSTPRFSPTCAECGHSVTADEIFCPWCGALPGS